MIAQHISNGFDRGLADWLNKASPLINVEIPCQGETLEPGLVYLAPSDAHMEICLNGIVAIHDISSEDIYIPSCDRLFKSAARAYGIGVLGIVLTGMGTDGCLGMEQIKAGGGRTIAQDEATSVIFGMPRAAIERAVLIVLCPLKKLESALTVLPRVGFPGFKALRGSY